MLYTLEQGRDEKDIIKQCVARKLPLPNKIANAPQLLQGLELFYIAFMDLNSCRSMGFGEGPIPWTAIRQMADEELGLVEEQRSDLFFHIAKMDSAYLKFRESQQQKPK